MRSYSHFSKSKMAAAI